MELSYISGNGNPEKLFIFQETKLSELEKRKKSALKKLLIFRKLNFLDPSLKNFLYFRRDLQSPKNQNFLYSYSYE